MDEKLSLQFKWFKIKTFSLICRAESVAQALVQGLTQFNVFYECRHCLDPGEWARNKNSSGFGNKKYSYKHMLTAVVNETSIVSLKSPSHLINLWKPNIIKG